jgi:hypothetical protein
MAVDSVAVGAETSFIWNEDGSNGGRHAQNAESYTGFLLYVYGVHSAKLISGGQGSWDGGIQTRAGVALGLRRSGTYQAETAGNYNSLGWFQSLADDDWWRSGNLGNEPNDLYSIAHHEIGHALFFDRSHPAFARFAVGVGAVNDEAVIRYHGHAPKIDGSNHLNGEIDSASGQGSFGYEYYGNIPRKRWIITKLDLLCAQAIGYKLRETEALRELRLKTAALPDLVLGEAVKYTIHADGGIPLRNWRIESGNLPPGVSLDSFTGSLSGIPTAEGAYSFTARVSDGLDPLGGSAADFVLHVKKGLELRLQEPARRSPREFSLQVQSSASANVVVERSLDLRQWMPLKTNLNPVPAWEFLDPDATNASGFYRALESRE